MKNEAQNEKLIMEETNETLTLGEKLVGIKFNPDNRDDVHIIKSKFAEVIDILNSLEVDSSTKEIFVSKAINEVITAQMWAVKTVTWKE